MTSKPAPKIWLLLDDRAGNRSQCMGVGDALGLPYDIKELSYSWAGQLPNLLLGSSFRGLTAASRHELQPPWPDMVIAAGRRTAPIARHIKRLSSGKTKLVQIMWPGGVRNQVFDVIAVPAHDSIKDKQNIFNMLGSPHKVTPDILKRLKAEWDPRLSEMPGPKIALIVGGSSKNRVFTNAMAKDLASAVSEMANRVGGSLLVTTSRRTGDAENTLIESISAPATIFKWGDQGENPYPAFLACADAIIVTGESMSMCSEACSGEGPVYIYAPQELITAKHKRLHDALFKEGYAKPFSGTLENWTHPPLNSALDVANVIHNRLLDRPANA